MPMAWRLLGSLVPGCCRRSPSRPAGARCSGSPGWTRTRSGSGGAAFSWLWNPTYRKPGPRRLSCAQTARAQAALSATIRVHSRSGVLRVLWCSNTAHGAKTEQICKIPRSPSLSSSLGCQIGPIQNHFSSFSNSSLAINKFPLYRALEYCSFFSPQY